MKNTIIIAITILIVAVIGFISLQRYMDWKAEQDRIHERQEWINSITSH
jgi:hypothetical protein